jgi:hypothetical protein
LVFSLGESILDTLGESRGLESFSLDESKSLESFSFGDSNGL